ncbi:MAG: AraC family transcriptional regulator [Hahellaceae bacterium]|nr:AraC family transcriptional regulator [Hahellaceae bacterium]MCP5210668.1 AraC family transcriptional regulator [Hahellaceae bacterium]
MSSPSDWPLSPKAIRFIMPEEVRTSLAHHPLSAGLYPLSMGYYPDAIGHRMSRENHDDYLLIYCVDGAGDIWIEGRHHAMNRGDLALLPKGCSHHYQSGQQNPWSIFWVHFEGEQAEGFVTHLQWTLDSPIRSVGVLPRLIKDIEHLMGVRLSGFNLKALVMAASNLRQLLAFVASIEPLLEGGTMLDLDEVHGFMQRSIHRQLDLETLAKRFHLSKYYFSKRYKAMTGQSPMQQFIRFKMEHACYLLDVSSLQVSAVAAEVGYEDAYYFSRLFSKVVGLSPSRYRHLRLR